MKIIPDGQKHWQGIVQGLKANLDEFGYPNVTYDSVQQAIVEIQKLADGEEPKGELFGVPNILQLFIKGMLDENNIDYSGFQPIPKEAIRAFGYDRNLHIKNNGAG